MEKTQYSGSLFEKVWSNACILNQPKSFNFKLHILR